MKPSPVVEGNEINSLLKRSFPEGTLVDAFYTTNSALHPERMGARVASGTVHYEHNRYYEQAWELSVSSKDGFSAIVVWLTPDLIGDISEREAWLRDSEGNELFLGKLIGP